MEGYHWSLEVLITRAEGCGLSPVRGWVTRVGAGAWVQVGDVSVRAFCGPEATVSFFPPTRHKADLPLFSGMLTQLTRITHASSSPFCILRAGNGHTGRVEMDSQRT